MNRAQVEGLIRQVLPLVGGIATTLGVLSPEQVGEWTTLLTAVGPVLAAASMIWSMESKTDKAIVASAIALPEVNKIECATTPEGVKLAESVLSADVVAVPPLEGLTEGPWRTVTGKPVRGLKK